MGYSEEGELRLQDILCPKGLPQIQCFKINLQTLSYLQVDILQFWADAITMWFHRMCLESPQKVTHTWRGVPSLLLELVKTLLTGSQCSRHPVRAQQMQTFVTVVSKKGLAQGRPSFIGLSFRLSVLSPAVCKEPGHRSVHQPQWPSCSLKSCSREHAWCILVYFIGKSVLPKVEAVEVHLLGEIQINHPGGVDWGNKPFCHL